MTTSVYFGVTCGGCDERIRLVEVISGPRIYQWYVPQIPPFEVRCPHCGTARTYRYRHIEVFSADTIEYFQEHPAFRNV